MTDYKKLVKAANYLLQDAEEGKTCKMDMDQWATIKVDGKPVVPDNACATSACAMGKLALAKLFKGLTLEYDTGWGDNDASAWDLVYKDKYGSHEGFYAPAYLFDINIKEAEVLFGGSDASVAGGYRKGLKAQIKVANRIIAFVEAKVALEEVQKLLKKNNLFFNGSCIISAE